ncbi:Ger(x)C family spore germination protein [Paenibacillus sp. MMS18-CY102]|uniref:Ger(x)C family spore germination protein n=1 Tax=Paenibacillus sp. MMS18-CY102 TaxID=2682849 RepID=UPI00136576B3|nr:Ger(x)C family spore germination protein [Paenibacillus sp. MMS18-CY102]MWC28806.1 Ger(x)C family spore germination protein [Paenibacillus sp. MMS18-CY102]
MKRVRRLAKLVLAALVLASTFFLTGCWNSRELNSLAVVTAMAIDKAEHSDEYELSFQVVMPGELSSSGKSGNGYAPFSIYSVRSNTLFEGIRKASKQVPRQLFFSHVQVVVLGERIAKSGIKEIFDFFERSHEVRLTSMLLVAKGTSPSKLISAIVPLSPLEAEALLGASEVSSRIWSESPIIGIDDTIRKLINPGAEPSISGVKIVGDDEHVGKKQNLEQTRPPYHLEVSGVAVFREGKLAGWLENEKARGYMLVANRTKSTVLNLPCEGKPDGVALEVIKSKTKTDVSIKNGRVNVKIHVMSEGNVAEVKCGIPLGKLSVLTQLEQEWGEETKANMMAAIRQAQTFQADVFGFGIILQRTHPKQWKQYEETWGETFAEAEVSIAFEGQIQRAGMRGKSLLEKEKS